MYFYPINEYKNQFNARRGIPLIRHLADSAPFKGGLIRPSELYRFHLNYIDVSQQN